MPEVPPCALIVDWGGVLTNPLGSVMESWAASDGVDYAQFRVVMRDLLGLAGGELARFNPVHALERGEIEIPEFEQRLGVELATRSGMAPEPGFLPRMFEHFEHAPDMIGLVRRAHAAGLVTALLSNSWGNDYPRDGWAEMFDEVVISGEVGMRKPEPEIFRLTLDLLGLAGPQCVFVDDLPANVRAAAELGMVGVLHTSYACTAAELDTLFGILLSA